MGNPQHQQVLASLRRKLNKKEEKLQEKEATFQEGVRCVDRSHIPLSKLPEAQEAIYVCKKGGHSINGHVFCDAKLYIINAEMFLKTSYFGRQCLWPFLIFNDAPSESIQCSRNQVLRQENFRKEHRRSEVNYLMLAD